MKQKAKINRKKKTKAVATLQTTNQFMPLMHHGCYRMREVEMEMGNSFFVNLCN